MSQTTPKQKEASKGPQPPQKEKEDKKREKETFLLLSSPPGNSSAILSSMASCQTQCAAHASAYGAALDTPPTIAVGIQAGTAARKASI